ncbi:MAG: sulfatase [Planctomycetota bacterium]|jgi:arylsulfatase A-like enzyme
MRLTLILGAVLPTLLGCAGESPKSAPRNVLLLSIDTLRADALGSYGNERRTSAFLDRWAERGVRFTSAWSHSPKTAPSHMTMLTGLAPRVHGVGNLRTASHPSLGPEATTLAEVLSSEGFATAGITDGGNMRGRLGFNRGFDVYIAKKAHEWGPRAAQVRQWLTARDPERPWFLFFHTYHVHDPYFPPQSVAERFVDPDYAGRIIGQRDALEKAMETEDLGFGSDPRIRLLANYWERVDESDPADLEHLRDLYLASVADLDSKLERLFTWLEAEGHLDSTLVIVTSDHGEEFGEHGMVRHDQLYRELLHVPLLVRFPDDAHAGLVIEEPVRHVDLFASVLELLDIDLPSDDVGPSWASWIDSSERSEPRRILAEHRSTRESALDQWSLRDEGWMVYRTPEATELFDLGQDPDEQSPSADEAALDRLLSVHDSELERLLELAEGYTGGTGGELSAETRAELEALGYF